MSRERFLSAGFPILVLVALGCKERSATTEAPRTERPVERVMEAPPEPAHSSYEQELASASLAAVVLEYPARPFPESMVVGEDSLDLIYGEEDAGYSFRPYGPKGGSVGQTLRFDVGAPREARRGSTVYRIDGRALIVSVEGSADSDAPRSWDSDHALVAGPIVFQDKILVATDKPSFVALDRSSLTVVFERPMEALASGPLLLLSKPRLLAALHADGSVGLYSLEESGMGTELKVPAGSASDPVAALVDPSPAAIAAMESKTASLMGRGAVRFPSVRLYGPQREVSGTEPSLFRLDADEKGGPMRLYLDGAGKRPYLVAVFNVSGEFIKSNIDYMGAENVLEHRFEPKAAYFFAVSFLSDSGETAEATGVKMGTRFTIVPKK